MPEEKSEFKITDYGILKHIQGKAGDLSPLLKQTGALMVSSRQDSINREKRHGKPYPERGTAGSKVKNVAGLIEDVNAGGDPKLRRFDARPVLRDTGNLIGSLSFQVEGGDTVECGTKLPYAETQFLGLDVEKKLTDLGLAKLQDFLDRNKEYISDLNFLVRKKEYKAKVKARDFINFEEEELKDYDEMAVEFFS